MFPVNIKKVETNTFEYSFKNKTLLSKYLQKSFNSQRSKDHS